MTESLGPLGLLAVFGFVAFGSIIPVVPTGPAVSAAAFPKLRRNRIARTLGSRPAIAHATSHEASRLPSSTNRNSAGPSPRSSKTWASSL